MQSPWIPSHTLPSSTLLKFIPAPLLLIPTQTQILGIDPLQFTDLVVGSWQSRPLLGSSTETSKSGQLRIFFFSATLIAVHFTASYASRSLEHLTKDEGGHISQGDRNLLLGTLSRESWTRVLCILMDDIPRSKLMGCVSATQTNNNPSLMLVLHGPWDLFLNLYRSYFFICSRQKNHTSRQDCCGNEVK